MEARHFHSPEDTEKAFYEAMSNGDRSLLTSVWSGDVNATLVKTNGEIVTQGVAIVSDIAGTFEGRAPFIYRLAGHKNRRDKNTAIHCQEESIYIEGDRRRQSYAITTNVFILEAGGWKLFLRHLTTGQITKGPLVERRALPNTLVRNLDVLGLLR